MFEPFGPLVRIEFVIASSFIICLAIFFWWEGHISWLIIKQKKMPPWLIKQLDNPNNPLEKVISETKTYHIYLGKGIGWGIIILFTLFWLFESPRRWDPPYPPIIGNIALFFIGEVMYVIFAFIVIIGILRWITRG